jgi:hypothetical protein
MDSTTTQDQLQLLLSELLAGTATEAHSMEASGLQVEVLPTSIRIEASGPALELVGPAPSQDSIGEPDVMLVERIAYRWGVDDDDGSRVVWFEIPRASAN